MEDLSTKAPGSLLTAEEFNQPMSEIQRVITNSGIGLSSSDSHQMAKALSTLITSSSYLDCTGSFPTKILTTRPPYQPITGYVPGMLFRFRATDVQSGAVTLNVDGHGAKPLLLGNGDPVRSLDITPDADAEVRYDSGSGGRFFLINPQVVEFSQEYMRGLTHSVRSSVLINGVYLNKELTVTAGSCSAVGGGDLTLDTDTTKSIDPGTWTSPTVGMSPTGVDLMDNDSGPHDEHFRLFVIGGPTVTTSWGVDISANSDAVALRSTAGVAVSDPGGYTKYRQIGWMSMEPLYYGGGYRADRIRSYIQNPNNLNHIMWADVRGYNKFCDQTFGEGHLGNHATFAEGHFDWAGTTQITLPLTGNSPTWTPFGTSINITWPKSRGVGFPPPETTGAFQVSCVIQADNQRAQFRLAPLADNQVVSFGNSSLDGYGDLDRNPNPAAGYTYTDSSEHLVKMNSLGQLGFRADQVPLAGEQVIIRCSGYFFKR